MLQQEQRRTIDFDYEPTPVAPVEVASGSSVRGNCAPKRTFEDHEKEFCSWEPEFANIHTFENGAYPESEDFKLIVNSKTRKQLGTVTKNGKYTLLSHQEQFDAVRPIVESGKAAIVDSGFWKGGKSTYIKLRTPMHEEVVPGEGPTYLEVSLIHKTDGSGSYTAVCNTMREVCKNGMMANDGKNFLSFRIPHTKDINERHSKILEVINSYLSKSGEIFDNLKKLASVRCTNKNFDEMLDKIYPRSFDENGEETTSTRTKNVRESIKWHTRYAQGGAGMKQSCTLYDALQGVTAFFNHGKQLVTNNTSHKYESPELKAIRNRNYSNWNHSLATGSDCKKQNLAFNYVMDLAA